MPKKEIPIDLDEYTITELAIKIPKPWLKFMIWCKTNAPFAQVGFSTVQGMPADLDVEYTKVKTKFNTPGDPLPLLVGREIFDFASVELPKKLSRHKPT